MQILRNQRAAGILSRAIDYSLCCIYTVLWKLWSSLQTFIWNSAFIKSHREVFWTLFSECCNWAIHFHCGFLVLFIYLFAEIMGILVRKQSCSMQLAVLMPSSGSLLWLQNQMLQILFSSCGWNKPCVWWDQGGEVEFDVVLSWTLKMLVLIK